MKKGLFIFVPLLLGTAVYLFSDLDILRNYLPDTCWAIALCQAARYMIQLRFPLLQVGMLLSLPFVTEIGQTAIFPGTYDPLDLLFYFLILLFFFHLPIFLLCKRLLNGLQGF